MEWGGLLKTGLNAMPATDFKIYCPVESSMFRRRNMLEENVQAMIFLEVEIRKSSISKNLMHMP